MTEKSKQNILVIGGAGYIGSVLVRKLLMSGFRVTALDNLLYNNGCSIAPLIEKKSFQFIKGDFCDKKTAGIALADSDHVVLLAALVGDPLCKKYPDEAVRVNEKGTMELLDMANDYKIGRFVFMSTCSNYGLRDDDSPADEGAELNPKSLYAETKVKVERYLIENSETLSYNPVILRCATAMGQSYRMRFDLTVSEFTRELMLERELLVYDENTWRPYCHVSDISDAIVMALKADKETVSGEVFNVGSDTENYTKKMLVDIMSKKIPGTRIKIKEGGGDPRNYRVSFDKVRRALGFEIEYNVSTTIEYLTEAIRSGLYDDVESRKEYYGNYHLPV